MTSAQHRRWIESGLTWQLARPLLALRDRLRSYGYTVYDIGNTEHLDHSPPEDHTPYSETGWPIPTPYGWVTAIDIMPPPGGLPSLQALGAQVFADKEAGRAPWLKYMNWGPTSDQVAVQDSWEPDHYRRSSSDTGHIHISARSDMTEYEGADYYNPVARLRSSKGPDMIRIGVQDGDGAVYLTTGNGTKTHIGPDLNDALDAGGVPLVWVPSEEDMDLVVNVGVRSVNTTSR
jgi:hypothetical protein